MVGKRGTNYFEMSFEVIMRLIVVFVFVFLPVYVFVNEVTTSTYFEKNYLALDLSMMTDTVLASPNDLIFNYHDKDTKDFSFKFEENSIKVYHQSGSIIDGSITKADFISNPSLDIYAQEMNPIEEYYKDKEVPDTTIPVKISIVKAGETVRFYNIKEVLLGE